MWILYAFASAFFAGVTAVLAKLGMEGVNSHLATALRTIVVALFGWAMVWVAGSSGAVGALEPRCFSSCPVWPPEGAGCAIFGRSSLERSTRWPPWINPALC